MATESNNTERPTKKVTSSMPTPRPKLIWALWAILALVATACGESFDSVTDSVSDDFAMETSSESVNEVEQVDSTDESADQAEAEPERLAADAPTSDVGTDPAAETGTGDTTAAGQTAADIGREIIFTANVIVGVDDVALAGTQATEVIEDLGGFVFGQESIGGNEPQTVLVFKVRPDDFQTALENLGGLGELRNQSVTTDDVTERVVDLESRIQTTELGVERLRTAMENADDINAFATLEQQLLARESDLEVLRGTLRTLRDQIDLSTITVTFVQDRVDNSIRVQYSNYEGLDAGASCPGNESGGFDAEDEVTICFEIVNQGDQTLTDINLTETALGIDDISELDVVFGNSDELAPGQSVMLSTSLEVERSLNLRVNATATPTNGTSTEAAGPAVRATTSPQLFVQEAPNVVGFGDGFETGAALLAALWQFAQVLAGFFIPLLVLLPLAWLGFIAVRFIVRFFTKKRSTRRETTPPAPPAPGQSPSSPTPPAPQSGGDEDGDSNDDDGHDENDDQNTREVVMAGGPPASPDDEI